MNDHTDIQMGGLVIGTVDPDRLAAWYRAAFAEDSEPGDVVGSPVLAVGGARLVFDRRDDVQVHPVEPGRVLLNLYVGDITAVEAHLNGLGITWIRPVDVVAGFGSIGTLTDADGNYVQVLQPENR